MRRLATTVILFTQCLSIDSCFTSSFVACRAHQRASTAFAKSRDATATTVGELQQRIEACIASSQDPEEWISKLEEMNPSSVPNRSPHVLGEWHVWYTNCPPPSNGQLGPFQGSAAQVIETEGNNYKNILSVPPNNWLSATLDGIWEEWDGTLLNTKERSPDQVKDWGAAHWKVTFIQLQIALLGVPIFTKAFDNTSRIWRTTYLDDEIRVVRAGPSGRRDDEYVFYTRRTPI